MKKTTSCLLFLFIFSFSNAQFTERFAMIPADEININTCDFDPEAGALILLQEGSADYDSRYRLVMYYHIRIKILKKDIIDDLANVKISYYSDGQFETIDDINAVTINIDQNGKRVDLPVDKRTIYDKKKNDYWSEVSFAFPNVNVGSIIEYRYRSTKRSFTGLRDWSFQSAYPVIKSTFYLKPSPNVELTYSIQKAEIFPITIEKSRSEGAVYFEMNNIPGMDKEPYMDTKEDYLQKINFQLTKYVGMGGIQRYMESWNHVARELFASPDYGGQLKVRIPDDQKLMLATIADRTDFQKMTAIYNYIRSNYKWNRFTSRHAGDGLKSLYSTKTGTSGAINYALINLLRAANLEAYPLMVSERNNGKINTERPFVSQFNTTYAYVLIDGKSYYLDGIDMYTPAHLIPTSILNTTGLLLKKQTGVLVEIKEDKYRLQDMLFITSELHEDGMFTGKVQRSRKDYSRIESFLNRVDDPSLYKEWLKKNIVNIELDSLSFENIEDDTLALKENFIFSTHAQQTGDYIFVPLNMFMGTDKNPFISPKRFSEINFGTKRLLVMNHFIKLPPNMEVDVLPVRTRMVNPDKTIEFVRDLKQNTGTSIIQIMIRLELVKSKYSVAEYSDIQEFYKKMTEFLNEQIVLKRKS